MAGCFIASNMVMLAYLPVPAMLTIRTPLEQTPVL